MSTVSGAVTEQTSDRPSALSAVATLVARPFTNLDEVIAAALQLISDGLGLKLSMVHRLEGDSLIVSHVFDKIGLGITPPVTIHRTDTFCDEVLASVTPLIVLDADLDPYVSLPGKQLVGTKSYIGVPILLNDNRVYGTLCAHDRRALNLGQSEVDFLLVLARFVASHIERDDAMNRQEQVAQQLAVRNTELSVANQQLHALNRLAESISAHLDIRSVMGTVIASAVELLDADCGAISLLGSSPESPRRLTATFNLPYSLENEALPANAGLMGQVLAARGPVIVERYEHIAEPLHHHFFHERAPWIAAPIWWEGEIIGTFGIGAGDPDRLFRASDIDLLTQLAKHAAISIENARLYSVSRDLGAAEERNRLAAEIHDTLAQSLLALTFHLRSARGLVSAAPDRAVSELQEAEERTRAALDEARRSVWNLGPASLEAGTLVQALQGELSASGRNGLPGTLVVSGNPRPLHAETQLALFRIAQEALANSRKHARASDAQLSLEYGKSGLTLTIADDGIGFDVEAERRRPRRTESGYGLISMKDRIDRIGGTFTIDGSHPAGGTRVIATAPYEPGPRAMASPTVAPVTTKTISVVVADDHPATRAGIASILNGQEGITVVATASDGEEALSLVEMLQPDVLMIDLRMPKLSGVEAIARLNKLDVKTRAVAVTTFAQDELVYQAMRAGARGYLLKDASAEDLVNAIRVIHAGGTLLAPVVAGKLAVGFAATDQLTGREREVLGLLARGLSDKEIAQELGTSPRTSSFHVANVIAKLGAQNRAEVVRVAYERGLLDEGRASSF